MSTIYTAVPSPVGSLTLVAQEGALVGLYMAQHLHWAGVGNASRDDAAFAATRAQLEEYFAGDRTSFDLPVRLAGTPFQHEVWQALRAIPYGATISYGELAQRIGRPAAVRAVGLANGKNPVSIVVPCHRVIGSDGSLTGYGGGLERKRYLLELEQRTTLFSAPLEAAATAGS
jgi:methylated-DNA-[protein]-cysteine S-methyltransferase